MRNSGNENVLNLITTGQSEQSSYWQSYMDHLDDVQTARKPLKKRKKLKYIFMTFLGLAKSSLQFVLSKFGIDTFDSLEIMRFSAA